MNTDPLRRIQAIDPASPDGTVPDRVWDAQQVFDELQRRAGAPVLRRQATRRTWLIVAMAAAAVLVSIGGVALLTRVQNNTDAPPVVDQIEPAPPTTVPADAAITAFEGVVTDVIQVGDMRSLVATADAVWVAVNSPDGGLMVRIDATTREVTNTISVVPEGKRATEARTFRASSPLATPNSLWVVIDDPSSLARIDLESRTITHFPPETILGVEGQRDGQISGGQISGLVASQSALWIQTTVHSDLIEMDLDTGEIKGRYTVGQNSVWWREVIDGGIWLWNPFNTSLTRFDLATRNVSAHDVGFPGVTEECCVSVEDAIWLVSHTGTVQRFDLQTLDVTDTLRIEGARRGIAAAGAIWIPSTLGKVVRIDPESRQITHEIAVGADPGQPTFADGAIWVPNRFDGTVSRIDVRTLTVTQTIQVGPRPATLLAFDGAIWVSSYEDGAPLIRIQTRT